MIGKTNHRALFVVAVFGGFLVEASMKSGITRLEGMVLFVAGFLAGELYHHYFK